MASDSVTELRKIQTGPLERGSGLTVNSASGNFMIHSDKDEVSTREQILADLEGLGIEIEPFHSLPNTILADVFASLKNIADTQSGRRGRFTKRTTERADGPPMLSNTDKKIIQALLNSKGSISSLTLSKNLDIPLSTVQRRRKRLEASLLETSYTIKFEKFGLRSATLFITTASGSADSIGREIVSFDREVISVKRCFGESSVDLQAKVIFKSNRDLLAIIEKIKSLDGVSNVSWLETIKVIGQNTESFQHAIS